MNTHQFWLHIRLYNIFHACKASLSDAFHSSHLKGLIWSSLYLFTPFHNHTAPSGVFIICRVSARRIRSISALERMIKDVQSFFCLTLMFCDSVILQKCSHNTAGQEAVWLLLPLSHVCVSMQDCQIHSIHEERERGKVLLFSPKVVECCSTTDIYESQPWQSRYTLLLPPRSRSEYDFSPCIMVFGRGSNLTFK